MTARSRTRAAAALAVAVVMGALTACQPPAPDGRDLGVTLSSSDLLLPIGTTTAAATITAKNHGTTAATSATVALVAPTHLHATATVGGGGEACASGPVDASRTLIACPVGPLAPGASRTISLAAAPTGPGSTADITVAVSSDGTEPAVDPHPNRRILPVLVESPGEVDLAVVVFPNKPPTGTGSPSSVSSAFVGNEGPGAPTEVTVTQRFPSTVTAAEATFRRVDGDATGTCTLTPGLATCRTGSATVGSSASDDQFWKMDLHLSPGSDEDLPIAVEVTSPQAEPVPDRDNPNAMLVTHLSSSSASLPFWPVPRFRPGQSLSISTPSLDPIGADEVTVTVPPGFELQGVEGSTRDCVGTGTVVCPLSEVGYLGSVRFDLGVLASSTPVPLAYSFTSATDEVSGVVYLWSD